MASIFHREAKLQAAVLFALPIAAFVFVTAAEFSRSADSSSPYFWIGIGLMILGYILLAYTKRDQIKRRDFFTWGLTVQSRALKALYILSYAIMISGFLLAGASDRF
jgi:hypothetical protein